MIDLKVKFIGYDTTIIYDDYDRHEIIVQNLNEIDEICNTLKNRDDTFEISFKKKYELSDGNYLYSDEEHFSIDNPTIPKRELLLRKFKNISETINSSIDVRDEDIKKCYDILCTLVTINSLNDKTSFTANSMIQDNSHITVENLIKKLQTYSKDLQVLVDGYEGGLDAVLDTKIVNVLFDSSKAWYYGPFEENKSSKLKAIRLLSTRGKRV